MHVGLLNPVMVGGDGRRRTKSFLPRHGSARPVGIDLLAISVNDVLTLGARPLFFLDSSATGGFCPTRSRCWGRAVSRKDADRRMAPCWVVRRLRCGLYAAGEFDLAGFCVGIVEKARIVDGSQVLLGDVVTRLAPAEVHSK